jgi:hypothetical protein
MKSRISLIVLLTVATVLPLYSAEPITTGSLVREMLDMQRLAELPDPYLETVQYSSYDHRSTVPGGPDWFANSDGFGGEPVPNFEAVLKQPDEKGIGEYLICDVAGPGAIVRVWTAAIGGTLKVYLDDAEKPIFDGSAQEFLIHPYLTYARTAGIKQDLFVGTYQQRNACYFPMPFARCCRMVWTGNKDQIHFYQVQLRRYEPNANVKTFQPGDMKTYESIIRGVAENLRDPQGKWRYTSSRGLRSIETSIEPGQRKEVLAIDGPGALEKLSLKLAAQDMDRALRQTILHIVCDDFPHGQVEAPLGDFFGAAPGINPFNSAPLTVDPDGTMTCRYVMPYQRSIKVILENRGSENISVTGSALPMSYRWLDESTMHFRARWRVDHDLIADPGNVQDLPYLLAQGAGRFVGATVMLLNPNSVPSGGGNWWGEGDEKIFVNDDVRPSTFGTGSEDYYNYAWSSPDIFLFPYCGQPRNDGPANRGFVTNQRFHVLDSLPFKQRFAFYMELFSHERTPGVSYARIAYHYGRPGLIDDHVPITNEDLRYLELPADWQPAARGGAGGATFHQAEDLVQEKTNITFVKDNLWSGGKVMLWQPRQKGDEITLKLPIPETRRYALRLTMSRTVGSGKFSGYLNGKNIHFGGKGNGGIVDLHEPHRTLSRVISCDGSVEIEKGDQTLTIRNESDSKSAIGIDFIWVQKR